MPLVELDINAGMHIINSVDSNSNPVKTWRSPVVTRGAIHRPAAAISPDTPPPNSSASASTNSELFDSRIDTDSRKRLFDQIRISPGASVPSASAVDESIAASSSPGQKASSAYLSYSDLSMIVSPSGNPTFGRTVPLSGVNITKMKTMDLDATIVRRSRTGKDLHASTATNHVARHALGITGLVGLIGLASITSSLPGFDSMMGPDLDAAAYASVSASASDRGEGQRQSQPATEVHRIQIIPSAHLSLREESHSRAQTQDYGFLDHTVTDPLGLVTSARESPLSAAGMQLWVRGPFIDTISATSDNASPISSSETNTMVFEAHVDMAGLPRLHPSHSRLCLTVAEVSPGEARALTNRGGRISQGGDDDSAMDGPEVSPAAVYAMQCLTPAATFAAAQAATKRSQLESELLVQISEHRSAMQSTVMGIDLPSTLQHPNAADSHGASSQEDENVDSLADEEEIHGWAALIPGAAEWGVDLERTGHTQDEELLGSGDSSMVVGASSHARILQDLEVALQDVPRSEGCTVQMQVSGMAVGEYAATAVVMDSRGRKHKRTVVFEAALPKKRGKRTQGPTIPVGGASADLLAAPKPKLSIDVAHDGCRIIE